MLNRFERFICDITEIDLYWHRLATSTMKEHGLKGNYVVYFTMLHKNPEGLTSAELSTVTGKDKADVSRDIRFLEKAGLVTRVLNGDSIYRARIRLTEEGQTIAQKTINKAIAAVSCIGGSLDDAERDCFYRVLDEITSNMRSLSKAGIQDIEGEKH